MILTMEQFEQLAAQTTEQVLLSGGDTRLVIDPKTGVNKYGCGSHPDAGMVAFGSSTGSTISARGYAAASALHQKLLNAANTLAEPVLYRQELDRIRREMFDLCEFSDLADVATIFAASGTDLHLICAQLMAAGHASGTLLAPPLHVIMMDGAETGSGVSPALRGQHFSDNAALGGKVTAYTAMSGVHPITVSSVGLRNSHGQKRSSGDIDREVDQLISDSMAIGQRVLLIMIDVSKTGLIAPSPGYIAALRQRVPDQVDVLVDACQFRISNTTLNAYLKSGCMVALTGSKFLTGPVFSGILHVPSNLIPRLSRQKLPGSLADYSARAEWPAHWQATRQLSDSVNWGLLLRLEAAVAELKAFHALPPNQIADFLADFAGAIQQAISQSPHFELMAERHLDRTPFCSETSWDQIPTIFPFLLLHQPGKPLSREQTLQVYRQLQFPVAASPSARVVPALAATRCQLGQPVLCGQQYGMDVSALRMCASSRVIIEACQQGADSSDLVIHRALNVLKKAEYLIQQL